MDFDSNLFHLNLPILLVWGENDTLVPVRQGRQLSKLFPHAVLQIIPSAGHVPMFDQPQQFNECVLSFLDDITPL